MRANHNPTVRQYCVQPDQTAKPAGPQQSGSGRPGGWPVRPLGGGPVLPSPATLPVFCLRPHLYNPRWAYPTLPFSMLGSPGRLRGVDVQQVWVSMAAQSCLSHLSRGWRPQQAVCRRDWGSRQLSECSAPAALQPSLYNKSVNSKQSVYDCN